MKTVNPNSEQLKSVLAEIPQDQPIVMLNLLKFRPFADYGDGASDCSGRDAYFQRYSVAAFQFVKQVGGELLWSGTAHGSIIAPPGESWDNILLVRYPSINAFMTMLKNPQYQQCAVHRTAALDDSRLIASTESV